MPEENQIANAQQRFGDFTGDFGSLLNRMISGQINEQNNPRSHSFTGALTAPGFGLGRGLTSPISLGLPAAGATALNNLLNPGSFTQPLLARSIAQTSQQGQQQQDAVGEQLARMGLSGSVGGQALGSAVGNATESRIAQTEAQDRAQQQQVQNNAFGQLMQLFGLGLDTTALGTGQFNAQQAAKRQSKGALLGGLGSIFGTAIGALGGPGGAAIGNKLGGKFFGDSQDLGQSF